MRCVATVGVRAEETGEQQRRLTWRLRDEGVRAAGHHPLTAAADAMGHVAVRAARSLALPVAEQREQAARERWIALPTCETDQLPVG